MEIKLDAEAAASIASAAIFQSLSQEYRDKIITQAVEQLITPEKDRNRYGYGKTPLQEAFNNAINQAAFRVVREKIEDDPVVQQHILDAVGPLLTGAIKGETANGTTTLADALGSALGSWLADQARKS